MALFARRSPGPAETHEEGPEVEVAESSTSRFSALWSRSSGRGSARQADGTRPAGSTPPAAPAGPAGPDDGLKPSAMRRPEPLYGYVVGLELLVVAILNLTVTHGPGAPAHPQTTLAAVGVAASIAFLALIYYTRNRMAAGFGAIVAAFFVTLPRVPNSLSLAHIFALVIPMAFGLIITQRQRRATPKLARRGGAQTGTGKAARRGSSGTAATASGGKRGRRAKGAEQVAGPRPSARYTPPKSKRQATK